MAPFTPNNLKKLVKTLFIVFISSHCFAQFESPEFIDLNPSSKPACTDKVFMKIQDSYQEIVMKPKEVVNPIAKLDDQAEKQKHEYLFSLKEPAAKIDL